MLLGYMPARQSLFGMAKDADESPGFNSTIWWKLDTVRRIQNLNMPYLKEMVVRRSKMRQKPNCGRKTQKGAPRLKTIRITRSSFRRLISFVFDLVRLAQAAGRGLSLDKNSGGGSARDGLEELRGLVSGKVCSSR